MTSLDKWLKYVCITFIRILQRTLHIVVESLSEIKASRTQSAVLLIQMSVEIHRQRVE